MMQYLFDHIGNGIIKMQEMGVDKDDIKVLISGANMRMLVYCVNNTLGELDMVSDSCDLTLMGIQFPVNGNYPFNNEIILFTNETTYYPELFYRINLKGQNNG